MTRLSPNTRSNRGLIDAKSMRVSLTSKINTVGRPAKDVGLLCWAVIKHSSNRLLGSQANPRADSSDPQRSEFPFSSPGRCRRHQLESTLVSLLGHLSG